MVESDVGVPGSVRASVNVPLSSGMPFHVVSTVQAPSWVAAGAPAISIQAQKQRFCASGTGSHLVEKYVLPDGVRYFTAGTSPGWAPDV